MCWDWNDSLRSDVVTEKLFGLNGRRGNANVDLIFSQTESRTGTSATQSTTHGGFDDDPATMESVLRRIKRAPDSATIVPFPRDRNRGGNPFDTANFFIRFN